MYINTKTNILTIVNNYLFKKNIYQIAFNKYSN